MIDVESMFVINDVAKVLVEQKDVSFSNSHLRASVVLFISSEDTGKKTEGVTPREVADFLGHPEKLTQLLMERMEEEKLIKNIAVIKKNRLYRLRPDIEDLFTIE
jgi:hypothetical protein